MLFMRVFRTFRKCGSFERLTERHPSQPRETAMCLAIPMKVIETRPDEMAVVESGGVSMEISTQFLENLQPGEYVLVHTGFAIERLE